MDKKPESSQQSNEKTFAFSLFIFLLFLCAGLVSIWITNAILTPSLGNYWGISIGIGLFVILLIILTWALKMKYESTNLISLLKIILTILAALATIFSAIFSSAIIGPEITNFINPKYSILDTTIYIQPISIQGSNVTVPVYPFCVFWKTGQEYRLSVSSNGVPIGVRILNESYYNSFFNSKTINKNINFMDYNLGALSVFGYSTPYRPPTTGNYFIVITNERNQSAAVNLTVEASDTCADYPMVGGNEPIYVNQ